MSAPMIHPSPQPDAGYEYPPPGGSSYAYSEVAPMIHHSGHRPNASFDSRATGGVRTPSPTPSELAFIQRKGAFNIDRANIRKYFSKDYIGTWIALAIGIAITVLTIVFHDDIIAWLKPTGEKIKALPAGFLIPIAIFIVVSFPPLFGHELIAVVVGVIWGLGVGFAIVAAGTLAGEIISFLAFRYMCGARIEKSARKNLKFGVLMHVIRESGWRIILIARLSAIPPHFTTVVFAVCRTNLLVFTLTAIATLPRQFATVYLGVLADNASTSGTKQTTGQRILSGVVIGVTVIITIYAMRYIEKKIDEAKPAFIYARRKERVGLEGDEDRAFDARDDVEDGSLNAPYDPAPYRTPSPMMRATENNAPYDSTPYSNAPYDAPLPTRTAEDAPFAAPPPPTFHVSSH